MQPDRRTGRYRTASSLGLRRTPASWYMVASQVRSLRSKTLGSKSFAWAFCHAFLIPSAVPDTVAVDFKLRHNQVIRTLHRPKWIVSSSPGAHRRSALRTRGLHVAHDEVRLERSLQPILFGRRFPWRTSHNCGHGTLLLLWMHRCRY
jgi:hypothetical protein